MFVFRFLFQAQDDGIVSPGMDANVETSATSSSTGHYKVIASAKNVDQEPVVLSGTITTHQTVSEVLSSPGSPLLATPPKRPKQVPDPDEGTSPRRQIIRTAHEPKSPNIAETAASEKQKSPRVQEKSPARKERAKSTIQQYEDMDVDMLKFSSTDTSSSGKESTQNPNPRGVARIHQSPPRSGESSGSLLNRMLNPKVVSL